LFSNFGWLALAMLPAAAAVLYRRDVAGRMLVLLIAFLLTAWVTMTFIPGRFAVPLIVPAAILFAHANTALNPFTPKIEAAQPRHFVIWILVPAIGSLMPLLFGFNHAVRGWQKRVGIPITELIGRTDAFVANHPLNVILPTDARPRLIGDAAVFYIDRAVTYHTTFDRDPWLEFSGDHDAADAVAWLRERRVTHVVFNWVEIDRLRKTYGFSERVTPAWVAELEQAGLQPMPVSSQAGEVQRGIQILVVRP
jgi:hypothetical protein